MPSGRLLVVKVVMTVSTHPLRLVALFHLAGRIWVHLSSRSLKSRLQLVDTSFSTLTAIAVHGDLLLAVALIILHSVAYRDNEYQQTKGEGCELSSRSRIRND